MPEYTVKDTKTDTTVKFQWNEPNPPTDNDMANIFKEAEAMKPSKLGQIIKPVVSALGEPGRVFGEEVSQGWNTLKDLLTQKRTIPKTIEEALEPPDIAGGMEKAKQALGALTQIGFSPGTAFTKPILEVPAKKIAQFLGASEEVAQSIGSAIGTIPYFFIGGRMIPTPKALEISKKYGVNYNDLQNILEEAVKTGGVPQMERKLLPPGQGFQMVGETKDIPQPRFTKNVADITPVPEQKLLPVPLQKQIMEAQKPTILEGKIPPEEIAGVTKEEWNVLSKLGYKPEQVQKMIPDSVRIILTDKVPVENVDILPTGVIKYKITKPEELYTLGGGKKFKEEAKKILPGIKNLIMPMTPERAQEAQLKNLGKTTPTTLATEGMPKSVSNIMDALTTAERLTPEQKALYSAERGKRIQEAVSAGKAVGGGEAGYYAKLGQLKGELPKVEFETLRGKITQQDIDDIFKLVEKHPSLNEFEVLSAQRGLVKILGAKGGYLPAPREIELLRQVFPEEFISTLIKHKSLTSKLFEGGAEVLNLPRAVMASFDLSAPLRQGVFFIGKPKQFIPAFKDMFKYAFNEKAYQGGMAQIKTRPTYNVMKENVAFTEIGGGLVKAEERFMSNLAEKIPIIGKGIRASNRAYTGFLNKLRADVFDDIYKRAIETGQLGRNPDIAKDIGRLVNSGTGRGSLGELNKSLIVLNGIFFSPRLMASRLNLLNPAFYIKLDPFVRKEALKSLISFGGLAGSVLGLAKLGGMEVGIDPRSADFGKIKIGDTRYDIWGGFQQYMVLASRLASGEMVMSTTGKEYELGKGYKPTTRKDIIIRFLESKENPVLSFVTKLLSSEKNLNKEFRLAPEIVNRFIPMFVSDMYDLSQEKGAKGIPMALPGAFGTGVQTYGEQIPTITKDELGRAKLQWKNTPSLGENLTDYFTGEKISNIPESRWDQLRKVQQRKIEGDIKKDKIIRELIEKRKARQ